MRIRVLGLGNELLADDRFGLVVADQLRDLAGEELEVVSGPTAGLSFLDALAGASHLLVVDTLVTGSVHPGTLSEFREGEVAGPAGPSPHYVGLFEALALGRTLGLPMPGRVVILAVEPSDCLTVGGGMSDAVQAAIAPATRCAMEIIDGWKREGGG